MKARTSLVFLDTITPAWMSYSFSSTPQVFKLTKVLLCRIQYDLHNAGFGCSPVFCTTLL